ncbi:Two-component response regulator receiver [Trichoderma virens Gv29-8]|uniref:Transcription factor n=1 Tax=Hypocrea virens (strain Gv29-8 / FGSC 10586) TaxID=413071 RepID=G9MN11_HYPVG|nr:Two-component response regulator receiver [Trichoderma virens Gv29-8]EHK23304.1 Two-component response regulator receiver [Trichoderma virens Gv29-8]
MSGTEAAAAQGGGGNNASEFVRKLFRMLEDPSHQDVARWGKDGDSFVVVEGEKFTRSILPKHFKHSNMSSFIRQLNKYDFHKVKPSTDGDSTSPNGNILEFKHPYFRVDSKDDLDNIRRKAPATRKPQVAEDFTTSQHVSVISEQLTATQQQVQQLQELFADVSQTNRLLVNEVLTLQKMLNAQKQAQYEMLNYLSPYNHNRNNGMMGHQMNSNGSMPTAEGDEAVPELRRARELLSSVPADTVADRELERLHDIYESPADSATMVTPVSMPMMHDPMNDISRYPVYPVGQTVGIDPFHSDHINKIPYAIPNEGSSGPMDQHQQHQQHTPQPGSSGQMNNAPGTSGSMDKPASLWGPKKPVVFLVEDDPTCAKIGIKFLKSMGCDVEHANNGAEAFSRVSTVGRDHFDLIFMDIIMPRLDGVSATMYIRQHCPTTPIIAMTSNIRPDEVNGYFEHGMNGVLAKPFTKEGMLKSVKTNMQHLLKNPPSQSDNGHGPGFLMNVPYLSTTGNSIKFESPTPPAGASGSNWSSGHMSQNGVDQSFGLMDGSNQYNISQNRGGYSTMDASSGRISDHDSPPEKRQRLNNSQRNYA